MRQVSKLNDSHIISKFSNIKKRRPAGFLENDAYAAGLIVEKNWTHMMPKNIDAYASIFLTGKLFWKL
jgi:hypothetical protein